MNRIPPAAAALATFSTSLLLLLSLVWINRPTIVERAPTVTGPYTCCDARAGGYTHSFVGHQSIICGKIDCFSIFGKGSGCRTAVANGQIVTAERIFNPTIGGQAMRSVQLRSSTKVFFSKSDDEIRSRWIDESRISAVVVSLFLGFTAS